MLAEDVGLLPSGLVLDLRYTVKESVYGVCEVTYCEIIAAQWLYN